MTDLNTFADNFIDYYKTHEYKLKINKAFKAIAVNYDMLLQREDNDFKSTGLLYMTCHHIRFNVSFYKAKSSYVRV